MIITLIRHGRTIGNDKKVYLGLTNEHLSQTGRKNIINNTIRQIYPDCDFIYTSPLIRCIETKDIIYPDIPFKIINNLMECNFGNYEYKTYDDLKYLIPYQNWIDSGGLISFPNGESGIEFRNRSVSAFEEVIKDAMKNNYEKISIICHGGNIMAIMEAFEESKLSFYNWQIKNGEGFITKLTNKKLIKILSKIN